MRTNTKAVPIPLKGKGEEEGDIREGEVVGQLTDTTEGVEMIGVSKLVCQGVY